MSIAKHMIFEQMPFCVARAIEERELAGLKNAETRVLMEGVANELVIIMQGYILAENAGPVVRDAVMNDVYLTPRWMPRWMDRIIRKWCVSKRTWQLEVQPKYTYPSSTIKVPTLGAPVRFMHVEPVRYIGPNDPIGAYID